MPMHDWSRVTPGIYHNFHYLWLSTITNRLNSGLLPTGMIAMAEQVIGGPEPDVVTLQENDIEYSSTGNQSATIMEPPPRPKTQFVISAETERYAAKAHRAVVRHSLGKIVAVVELVSPGNKNSRHAWRSFVEKTVDLLYQNINLLVLAKRFPKCY